MPRKLIILSASILLTLTSISAQSKNKLWAGAEVGYGITLSDENITQSNKSISTLRALAGYYVAPNLSLGVAVGLSSYIITNTVPLFLDVRYHPIGSNPNYVVNWAVGYALATSENDVEGKFTTDISLGYKILDMGKIQFVPAIGYNYNTYSIDNPLTTSSNNYSQHSLFLKIGLLF